MSTASRIRGAKRRATVTLRRYMVRSGALAASFYYRLLGAEFTHEFRTVGAGLARYDRGLLTQRDIFHLRRNTHMLEKGLVMRPRRVTFAASYIEETVRLFEVASKHDTLSTEELTWVLHVLSEYFDATAASADRAITSARRTFATLGVEAESRSHVPHRRTESGELPTIDQLTSLAHARRSVRWFEQRSVERSLVDRAITVAMQAPTACNRQPFRFLILDDESRQQVASIPMGTAGFADQIPGLIVVIGDQSAFFDERDRHLIYIDSCLASMGLLLGLEAQGVSSCVINWPDIPEREKRIRSALSLAAHEQIIMLIAYGYEDQSGLAPYSAKKPLSEARSYASDPDDL